MTYAPTVTYLRDTALAAGAASFWHGKQQTQSINYDAAFPQAHLFLMPSTLGDNSVQHQVRMCFYGKDEHENADESIAIIDAMDVLSQQFIGLLYDAENDWQLGDAINRAPVWREGAQIGTGYFLTFTLTTPALC